MEETHIHLSLVSKEYLGRASPSHFLPKNNIITKFRKKKKKKKISIQSPHGNTCSQIALERSFFKKKKKFDTYSYSVYPS